MPLQKSKWGQPDFAITLEKVLHISQSNMGLLIEFWSPIRWMRWKQLTIFCGLIESSKIHALLLGGIGSLSIQIIYYLSQYWLPAASCSLDSLSLPQGCLEKKSDNNIYKEASKTHTHDDQNLPRITSPRTAKIIFFFRAWSNMWTQAFA